MGRVVSLVDELIDLDAETVVSLFGALAAGGVLSKALEFVTGRRKRKVDEAQVLSAISTAIREEVRKENAELRDRLDQLLGAVTGLTDILDDLFPKITGLDEEERIALRRKLNLAKRVS